MGVAAKSWMLILLLLLAAIPSYGQASSNEEYKGSKVLVEELTATWCEYCVIIDPQVVELQQVHASRLITITIHPKDDPLNNMAMDLRAARINISEANGTPAFWLNGDFYGQGVIDMSSLSRQVMKSESSRASSSELVMNPTAEGMNIELTSSEEKRNGSRLTIMLVEESITLRKGVASNGQTVFHNVLLNSFSIDLDNQSTEEGGIGWNLVQSEFTPDSVNIQLNNDRISEDDVFWVIIHERDDSSSPLAVISSLEIDNAPDADDSSWIWLLIIVGAFGIYLAFPVKKRD
jgi:thiol-disulfide isomerase/thioredoxin|tara:strand:+ start:106 stop:978 length:873 start_codon:yes stop_codon:yes gene_type:complete